MQTYRDPMREKWTQKVGVKKRATEGTFSRWAKSHCLTVEKLCNPRPITSVKRDR